MTENQRALELMGVGSHEQRQAKRRFVHLGGTLIAGEENVVAWIKDISDSGICLFTKKSPSVGQNVQIRLNPTKQAAGLQDFYEGTVIRVQASAVGAAYGVAICLHEALRKSA